MGLPDALRCLRRRNLQLFFGGQTVSLVGTWMQSVARQWLIWELTFRSSALGLVTFLGQIPVFLFSLFGGAVADRVPRRTLVVVTQIGCALEAVMLATVTLTHVVRPIHVYVLSAFLGTVNAFDIPARQSLLADLSGEDLGNAIALNSSIVNGARVLGPALAGAVVAAFGTGLCFLANALSYIAIIAALLRMKMPEQKRRERKPGQLREGLRYAWHTAHVRALLGLLAMTSVFGISYVALMPVFATRVLHGGPALLGWLFSAVGLGALSGAVLLLRLRGLSGLGKRVAWGSTLFGVALLAFAWSRFVPLSLFALYFVGVGFMTQMASTNTLLQGLVPNELRGRIMGLYSMAFVGMTPLGALGAGWLATAIGAPRTVEIGATVVLFASLAFHLARPGLRAIVLRDFPSQFPPAESE